MPRKSPWKKRDSVWSLLLASAVAWLSFGGCGKIRSRVEALLHSNHASKPKSIAHSGTSGKGARLAIILDDVGGDAAAVDGVFALHYRLTLSILPNHPHSAEIAEEAHRRGYEIMLHLPMESVGKETAETEELRAGMSSAQIAEVVGAMLQTVPYAAGVNNHQGSRATSDAQLMSELMPTLRARRLFFIDSRTTAATVAYDTAQTAGVRSAFRNVPFLDDVQERSAVEYQLRQAAKDAQERGEAIAIGHPHASTLQALAEFLPKAEGEGIQLVHASELVH